MMWMMVRTSKNLDPQGLSLRWCHLAPQPAVSDLDRPHVMRPGLPT